MKAIAMALAGLMGAVVAINQADACAMYKQKPMSRPETVVAEARAAERSGEDRAAIRLYERVMNDGAVKPALRAEAAVKAGVLHGKAGAARLNLRRLARANELNGQNLTIRLAYGQALDAAGEPAQAAQQFSIAAGLPGVSDTEARSALLKAAAGFARAGDAPSAEKHREMARLRGASPEQIEAAAGRSPDATLKIAAAPTM